MAPPTRRDEPGGPAREPGHARHLPGGRRGGPGGLTPRRSLGHPPAGEEGGQGQLGEDHQLAAPGLGLVGSTVPHRGAPSPVKRMRARQTRPPTMVGWRLTKLRRAADSARATPRSASAPAASVADTGVEEDIQEVDHQVEEHIDAGDDEHDALDHGVVAPHDGVDGQPADAGQGEDALVTTAPPMRSAKPTPMMVTTGSDAALRAWPSSTRRGASPWPRSGCGSS